MQGRPSTPRASRSRRGVLVALVLGLFVPLALTGHVGAGAQTAEDDFVTGSGRADARVLRFGPSSAQLGLTPSVSLALADFIGTLGRAESRAFDYAALDDSMPEEFKDHYSSTRVEAREESEVEEERSNFPFEHHARATDLPRGESTTHFLGFEVPGVLEVSEGRAHAFAGLTTVDGRPFREAGGEVVIDEVVLFGGQGILRGLRWEVLQRTDADGNATVDGNFVVGEGVFGGETFEGPLGPEELEPLLSGMNDAFEPTGLRIDAPELRRGGGDSVRMSPLGIRMVESELGNQVAGPLVEGFDEQLRPVLLDPLVEECDECASLVLVADVTLGVFSGAGRLDVELGGVFGITEGERFDNAFAERPGFGEAPPTGGGTEEFVEEVIAEGGTEVAPTTQGSGSEDDLGDLDDSSGAMQAPIRDDVAAAGDAGDAVEALSGAWAAAVVAAAGALGLLAAGLRRLRLRRLGLPLTS